MARDPATVVNEAAPYLRDIIDGISPATRNLRENQPGYPATTPGNGSPGRGTSHTTSITERLGLDAAEGLTDTAVTDLAQLEASIARIIPNHRALRDAWTLVVKWNYLTAGTVNPGLLARTAAATEHADNEARWCRSCLRLQHCEPIGKDGRAGLCNWCYRFHLAEKMDPPLPILQLRHQGRRISEAAVKAAVREERKAMGETPPKPKGKKKRK